MQWHKDCLNHRYRNGKKSKMTLLSGPKTAPFPRVNTGTRLAKALPIIVATAIICSFLFVTFAYACSGKTLTRTAAHPSSIHWDAFARNPCNEAKKDVCKDVRNRMLSIQAPPPQGNFFSYGLLPATSVATEIPNPGGLIRASDRGQTTPFSVMKRRLFVFYSILRI
jgi:hypothetical protein